MLKYGYNKNLKAHKIELQPNDMSEEAFNLECNSAAYDYYIKESGEILATYKGCQSVIDKYTDFDDLIETLESETF